MAYGYAEYIPVLKALADETRLRIIDMLRCGELCACKMLKQFSITQPTLSYHMKILTECGLVEARREGAWIHYSLCAQRAQEITQYLDVLMAPKANSDLNKEDCCDEQE